MIVLLDPGHGVETPGKRSPNGQFLEYKWNREVADLIYWKLLCMGVDARMLVSETNDISLSTRVQRVNKLCNQVGAYNVILISVHSNAAGNGKEWKTAKGWSCYTTIGETRSDKISECLYDAFEAEFTDRKIRKDLSDGDRDWESNFYIIHKSKCPAVLLENFFYDNREECEWLLKPETKERIAHAAVQGIIKYMTTL